MATKSLFKTVEISDGASARRFIVALEHSKKRVGKEVVMSEPVSTIPREEIKSFFGK
jgi:hypothetical protein